MDGLGGGFEVDPGIGQAQPERGAPVHGIGAEDPAQLGQQRVEPGVDRGGVGLSPQRLGQLVPGDLAMPVDDQVGEQQPALAAGQAALQTLAVALDGQRPADLDAHRVRRRQGHANIVALRWAGRPEQEARWRN